MQVKKLTEELAVAPQIEPADLPSLAAAGFRAVICNRPDGETEGQPSFAEIEKAAAASGIEVAFVPVASSGIADGDAESFGKALEALPKPALAYCRSGTRSTALWALSQAGKQPVETILKTAMEAGYDLRPLLPRLER